MENHTWRSAKCLRYAAPFLMATFLFLHQGVHLSAAPARLYDLCSDVCGPGADCGLQCDEGDGAHIPCGRWGDGAPDTCDNSCADLCSTAADCDTACDEGDCATYGEGSCAQACSVICDSTVECTTACEEAGTDKTCETAYNLGLC